MANANSHLQKYKKEKRGWDNKTNSTTGITTIIKIVIGNILLDQNMILLPLEIDPIGSFGLTLQHFLFDIQPTSPLMVWCTCGWLKTL
jgi:hypothetical protein